MRMFFGVLMLVVVLAIVGKLGKTQLESLGSVSTRVRSISPPAPVEEPRGPRDSSIVAVPGGMPGAAPAGVEGTVGYQAKQVQDDFVKATNRALQSGGPDRIKHAEP